MVFEIKRKGLSLFFFVRIKNIIKSPLGTKEMNMFLNDFFGLMGLSLETATKDDLIKIVELINTAAKLTDKQRHLLEYTLNPSAPNGDIDSRQLQELISLNCFIAVAEGINHTRIAVTIHGREVYKLISAEQQFVDLIVKRAGINSKAEIEKKVVQLESSLISKVIHERTKYLQHDHITEAANMQGILVVLYAAKTNASLLNKYPQDLIAGLVTSNYLRKEGDLYEITTAGNNHLGHLFRQLTNFVGENKWATSILFFADQQESLYSLIDNLMVKNAPLDPFYVGLFKGYGFLNRKGVPTDKLYLTHKVLCSGINTAKV
jgi:hypothetical protein